MSDNAWETVVGPWREAYEKQAELTRKSWLDGQAQLASILTGGGSGDTTDTSAAVGAAGELWRSWMELGGSLGHALPGFPAAEGVAADTLGHLTDPFSLSLVGGSQVGQVIRRMTEGPRFADIGANEHRAARLMELWMAVQTAARTYEGVAAGAWAEASQRFVRELAKRSQTDEPVLAPREILRIWLDIANQALLETQRSDKFLTAQQRLLRTGMDFLLAQREFVENLVEPAGLPTRTEMDEVHRTVQELKRRVRTLEKDATSTPRSQTSRGGSTSTAPPRKETTRGGRA